MGISPDQFVEAYVSQMSDTADRIDRPLTEPSGLDFAGMNAAMIDPRLGRLGISLMADFMAPEGSIYFDAIFGAYYGQADIRGWLVPAMAEIEFVDFVPTAPSVMFDDGLGGTSVDEWQMVANIGADKIPLARGVSVRRCRDGWITWACDVYDTGMMRLPLPPEAGIEAVPLPPWPRVEWITDAGPVPAPLSDNSLRWLAARASATVPTTPSGLTHQEMHDVLHDPAVGGDLSVMCDLFHPTESIHIDPLFGELRGQAVIRNWITDIIGKVGNLVYEPLGHVLFDGTTSVEEWKQMAVLPDGNRVMMLRGTTVRRFADGWLTYAADYFDTAPLGDAEIIAAGRAAGSTLTAADVARYRAI